MGYEKSIAGTFSSTDLVAGVLAVAYPATTINTPLSFVVFNLAVTSETRTFDPVKVDDHNCTVNIGEEYETGTWRYRLLYTND